MPHFRGPPDSLTPCTWSTSPDQASPSSWPRIYHRSRAWWKPTAWREVVPWLLLLVPLPAARASVLVTMPRILVALMPLAIVENLAHSAAGGIGSVLGGVSAPAQT